MCTVVMRGALGREFQNQLGRSARRYLKYVRKSQEQYLFHSRHANQNNDPALKSVIFPSKLFKALSFSDVLDQSTIFLHDVRDATQFNVMSGTTNGSKLPYLLYQKSTKMKSQEKASKRK